MSRRLGRARKSLYVSESRRSKYSASENVLLSQVVFPVPRGPKRKKLRSFGGLSNLVYITPFYYAKWSCQVYILETPYMPWRRLKCCFNGSVSCAEFQFSSICASSTTSPTNPAFQYSMRTSNCLALLDPTLCSGTTTK